MHNDYLWHQAYSQYPVVGVNWHQAKAFCAWRTLYKNSYIKKKKKGNLINSFRLPTEAEWEYSARGGLESASYPWGGQLMLKMTEAASWQISNLTEETMRQIKLFTLLKLNHTSLTDTTSTICLEM